MNLLLSLITFAAEHNQFTSSAAAYIAAAIAIASAGAVSIGQGRIATKAVEAISRQPEAAGQITVTMVIGQAITETAGIYALIIAIILTGK